MRVLTHRHFDKQYARLSKKLIHQTEERIRLFLQNSSNPILHNHALSGEYAQYYSINITGDVRLLYEIIDNDTIRLFRIGTHSELYG